MIGRVGLLAACLAFAATPSVAGPLGLEVHTGPPGGAIDRVCLASQIGLVDATAPSNNWVPLDVPLATSLIGVGPPLVFLGSDDPFGRLTFNVGLAGQSGAVDWYYWNGAFWATLAVLDGTNDFHNAGLNDVAFAPPSDWDALDLDSSCPGSYRYVLVASAELYSVLPVADYVLALP